MAKGLRLWNNDAKAASADPSPLMSNALQQLVGGMKCISLSAQPPSRETSGVDDLFVSAFANAMAGNDSLTSLLLDRNGLGDDAAVAIAAAIQSNHSLKSLDLDFNKIGNVGMCGIAEALKVNNTLHQLEMHSNRVGSRGAVQLSHALRVNSSLRTLSLHGNPLGKDGACALADALMANCTLRILSLHSCGVDNSAASRLGTALRINTESALHEFSLGQNMIGDIGAVQMAEMLRSNSMLQELQLEANRIGDAGALQLASALEVNKTLRELSLLDNRITKQGLKKFAQVLKKNGTLTRLSITAIVLRNSTMDEEFEDMQQFHHLGRAIKGAEDGKPRLDLTNVRLGDCGAIKVAELLERSGTLLGLNLDHCNIGDEGAGLNLDHCNIGDEGAARLAKALEAKSSVLDVSLADNDIGDAGARRLVEVLEHSATTCDMNPRGNPLGYNMRQELGGKVSSRLAFSSAIQEVHENCPAIVQCNSSLPEVPCLSGDEMQPFPDPLRQAAASETAEHSESHHMMF